MRILLLSTADTDLLAARASAAGYRLANPARVGADAVPALLDGVDLAVVRLLGGRQTWPDGLAAVLGSGVPTIVLGGEAVPDAELMAASTVASGVATEALSYLVEGVRRTWPSWPGSCPTRSCSPARVSTRPPPPRRTASSTTDARPTRLKPPARPSRQRTPERPGRPRRPG